MKISGFEKVISIDRFEYLAEASEHEICHITCCAKEDDIDSFLGLVDSDCTCEDEHFSFDGHITDISVSKDISGVSVEITMIGKTYIYDTDVHYRVFQSEEKTISDILSKIEGMSDIKYEGTHNTPLSGIIIQDGMTDWQFSKELARMLGEHIFLCKHPFIASYGASTIEITEEDCIDYKMSYRACGNHLVCRINKNLSMGDLIRFNNREFYIYSRRYLLEKSQYYFEYQLMQKKKEEKDVEINNNVFLEAIVKGNDDPKQLGRVQVSFANDKYQDCMEDDAIWLERSCFYSTGSFGDIFIPAVNDKVIVKVANGKGIVLGSLRTEKYSDVVQNIDSKYIIFDDQIFIEYKDGCISVANKDSKISISGDKTMLEIGDKTKISMESGKIRMKIDKTEIDVSEYLSTKTGQWTVDCKSDISISGTNVIIKGKSGVSIN